MIINSLLDTDLYKFTMMQVVLHRFPGAIVEYTFVLRKPKVDLRPFAEEIRTELAHMCQLRFQEEELEYLRSFSFFKDDFVDFLRVFQLNEVFVEITTEEEFAITLKGPWLHTIMFEVPVLAIISEVYFRNTQPESDYGEGRKRLSEKIKLVKDSTTKSEFKFSDFGTRRRFSFHWQEEVVDTLRRELSESFSGTSNVYFAQKFEVRPIGTMAHEYLQACQSLGPRLALSQKFAFECWAGEYRGELGIALSDTYSTDAFLRDFDLFLCKLFDGARQDSGNPIEWGERIIAHYNQHKVDPKSKTLVFSDALTFERALEIFNKFKDRSNPVFGIGTNLTNDLGYTPLDIVIKMTECNGQPVAKISDEPSKTVCKNASYLEYLKQVFEVNGGQKTEDG